MARKIKSRIFKRKDPYFGIYGVSRAALRKKREAAKNNLIKKQKEEKNTVDNSKVNEEFEKEYEAFIAKLLATKNKEDEQQTLSDE